MIAKCYYSSKLAGKPTLFPLADVESSFTTTTTWWPSYVLHSPSMLVLCWIKGLPHRKNSWDPRSAKKTSPSSCLALHLQLLNHPSNLR